MADARMEETIDSNNNADSDMDKIEVIVDKLDTIKSRNNNNRWTSSMEEQMNSWLYQVINESNKHLDTSRYFIFWDNFLSYFGMVITIIGTILVPFPELTWQIVLCCISVFGVIIEFMTRQQNYGDLSKVHIDLSKKYQDKANDIREQLILSVKDRINGKAFTNEIKLFLANMSDLSPQIPNKINNKYNKITHKAVKDGVIKISIDQGSIRDFSKLDKTIVNQTKKVNPRTTLDDLRARVQYEMNRNSN